jgi:hypothetical protein
MEPDFTKKGPLDTALLLFFALIRIVFHCALEAAAWFVCGALAFAPFAWLFGAENVRGSAMVFGAIAAAFSVPVFAWGIWSQVAEHLERNRKRIEKGTN